MSRRERLPNRRRHDVAEIEHNGFRMARQCHTIGDVLLGSPHETFNRFLNMALVAS
jgi:hypothetical protein